MGQGTHQRPRSQTFPLVSVDGTYISPPPSSEPLTPKLPNQTTTATTITTATTTTATTITTAQAAQAAAAAIAALASPALESANLLASPHTTPSSSRTAPSVQGIPQTPPGVAPTKDDAKKALEVVISFLRQQPVGFVEQDEYNLVGKLLEKFGLGGGGGGGGASLGQLVEAADTDMSLSADNSPS